MSTRVIRYRTTDECADENQKLVEEVFAELAERRPPGLRYSSFRLGDGTSFVHVISIDDDAPRNPLADLKTFERLHEEIERRCIEHPVALGATLVGAYDPADRG
jgi:hypothetical protein